jgi:D-ribose pyranose/furanose isomerase RbsD
LFGSFLSNIDAVLSRAEGLSINGLVLCITPFTLSLSKGAAKLLQVLRQAQHERIKKSVRTDQEISTNGSRNQYERIKKSARTDQETSTNGSRNQHERIKKNA